MSNVEAEKLREVWRIAMLALHELQGRIEDEGHRKAVNALRAIIDLTEE